MSLVKYNTTSDPTTTGVYACRIPDKVAPELLADEFLLWDAKAAKWCYLRSDQTYRGTVLGWVGPLQRKL